MTMNDKIQPNSEAYERDILIAPNGFREYDARWLHPEQLNLALSYLKARPERSLMIGDHPLDIETGHNAGALSAGVLTGRCRKEDFLTAGADIVFQEATDIIRLLK